eukprot:8459673-Lingulodinium_polyedra.AAC.1
MTLSSSFTSPNQEAKSSSLPRPCHRPPPPRHKAARKLVPQGCAEPAARGTTRRATMDAHRK